MDYFLFIDMKVALILVGFMRNWDYNYSMIKKEILDEYNPEVYISSYTYSKMYWNSEEIPVDTKKVLDSYKPKNYIFRDKEDCTLIKFKSNGKEKIGREYSIRQLVGWNTHAHAKKLLNFYDYDKIIKLRTDIGVKNFIINPDVEICIPSWRYHPGPCEPKDSYVDYIAYGNPDMMKKYFSLYDNMQQMHDCDIDISLGETLLKDYFDNYITKKPHLDNEVDWILRGELWASEKSKIFPL